MEKMFASKNGCDDEQSCCSTPDCRLDPPKWKPYERCCNTPCSPKRCPPKTRAKDTIKVDRMEVESCFLLGHYSCGEKRLPLLRNYIRMDVRRKGFCEVLLCQPPTRMRNDGAICFSWTDEFRDLPEGYYEGDIFIDGCECLTLLFYLPPCQVRMKGYDVIIDESCHSCGGR